MTLNEQKICESITKILKSCNSGNCIHQKNNMKVILEYALSINIPDECKRKVKALQEIIKTCSYPNCIELKKNIFSYMKSSDVDLDFLS